MQIFRNTADFPNAYHSAVMALGNFDGVHRGHQAVIGQAQQLAVKQGAKLGVITFEPHPRMFFQPDAEPFRLTPFSTKAHQLSALGIDTLLSLPFDEELSSLTAAEFVDQVLVAGLGVGTLVVGYDFKFGKGRDGDVARLQADHRFGTLVVDPAAAASGDVYSSTRIRAFLKDGSPGNAAALLGRPFEIEGSVQKGAQLGRTIGFPTANVDMVDYIRPAHGVYAVRAAVQTGRVGETVWCDGVANLGIRPTVDGLSEKLEVHIFDFERDLYDTQIRVAFIEFLRGEQKFDGLDALKEQIAKDCHAARVVLETRAAGA